MTPEVRKASPADWPAIARLCEDTGRPGGEPVDDGERGPFGEHWVGPYRDLRPDWTWVAVADGEVVGYLTGCPDTMAFEKERRARKPQPDSRELFPPSTRVKLWTEHPAHLHMNVAAGFRRGGLGTAMLRAFFAELKKAGVPSIHVICGPTAKRSWERMGFRVEAEVEAVPGVVVSALAQPLA